MKSMTKICLVLCVFMTLQMLITAYPRFDTMSDDVLTDDLAGYEPQFVKRRMGWGLCDGFFKWRCGKERVVVRGK